MIDMNALGDLIEARLRKLLDERDAKKPPEFSGPDLLTVPNAAKLTEYHPQTIREWMDAGKLRRHGGKGKLARVSRVELLEFLRAMGGGAASQHESASDIAKRILEKRSH